MSSAEAVNERRLPVRLMYKPPPARRPYQRHSTGGGTCRLQADMIEMVSDLLVVIRHPVRPRRAVASFVLGEFLE